MSIEHLVHRIEDLHRQEEEAYFYGDSEALQEAGDQLDHIVTDEAIEYMKGEQ